MKSARHGQMYRFRNDVALTVDRLRSFDNIQYALEDFWICCCYAERISGEWHIVICIEEVPATHTFRLDLRTIAARNFFGLNQASYRTPIGMSILSAGLFFQ